MQFVDKAFARRLESVEEMPQVYYARTFQKTRPEMGAAEEEICGGHMVFAGLGSPIGRATGVGLDRPFTAADLDRVEAFYRAHQAPSQVDLCPLHEPAVFELFKERGYAIAELNNVLYRKLDAQEEDKFPPAPAGCEIRPSRLEEADAAGAIVERAFFPDGAPEPFQGLIAPFYQMERALAFVASVDGKLVACGTGLVIPEHRVFALCGAGTLAEFRGRGLQTALLRARMAAAVGAGCEYAVVVTQGGTTSQRNAERLGFRVAYSKVTVIKNLASS
ncbi:MAG TPA: GNAT family N-acetyltransferase [Candidatus Sulfotelmatobacter sp.]|nr:GNAT family N-acetyltransferase [Candidatus Sulfotelmatobacter sp.]